MRDSSSSALNQAFSLSSSATRSCCAVSKAFLATLAFDKARARGKKKVSIENNHKTKKLNLLAN
jgi:hypothetical protein